MTENNNSKLRAGLIVDSQTIAKWQHSAVLNCQDLIQITTIIFCENSKANRHLIKNCLYYVLNFFSIRNFETKSIAWKSLITNSCKIINFHCLQRRNWQNIDESTRNKIAEQKLDVIVKFGMNLLADPQLIKSKYGVLSFHHGDPGKFRGRPAGFYELLTNAGEIGVVVQELSNKLDAGMIRAEGHYQITRHSYRKTLERLFSNSSILLRHAIINCLDSNTVQVSTDGKNNRLPSNSTIMKFCFIIGRQKLRRFLYGLLFRRNWQIGKVQPFSFQKFHHNTYINLITTFETPPDISFMADPFILPTGEIICEVTSKNSTLGYLATLNNKKTNKVDTSILASDRHLSFPFVVESGDQCFLMPEMAQCGAQLLCEIDKQMNIIATHELLGLQNDRLIDPVLLFKDSKWWLFAGKSQTESDHLYLWSSSDLLGPYQPHRMNPVVTSASRARNGGAFVVSNGNFFRVGQNNCRNYGDGITICRVDRLDDQRYEETPVTQLKLEGCKGPHTYSSKGESAYIDFYQTIFDPLAWLTRLKSKF